MKTTDATPGPWVLVIVHAQPQFSAAGDPFTLGNICREAQLAVKSGFSVLALEFPDQHVLRAVRTQVARTDGRYPIPRTDVPNPKTQPCILKLLDGYDKFAVRHTFDSDCGVNIVYGCWDRGFPSQPGYFRLVGVNTDACVLKTTIGLRDLRPNARIELVQDACNTSAFPVRDGCWDLFPKDVILSPGGGPAPKLVAPILHMGALAW